MKLGKVTLITDCHNAALLQFIYLFIIIIIIIIIIISSSSSSSSSSSISIKIIIQYINALSNLILFHLL